jgi:predicted phage tail protein
MSLAKVNFHGNLGKRLGRKSWNLSISSVREAFHAVNTLTERKLSKIFLADHEKRLRYQVKINNKPIDSSNINPDNIQTILDSELCINTKIETIDIIPLLEGSGSKVMGVIMTVVGVVLLFTPGMQAVGLALLSAGMSVLLAKPPKFDDFREIEEGKKKVSYLFDGPTNAANEGGPVPIGYGRLIVGSQVIQTSQDVIQKTIDELGTYRAGV